MTARPDDCRLRFCRSPRAEGQPPGSSRIEGSRWQRSGSPRRQHGRGVRGTDLPDGEAHILGHFIDYSDPDFIRTLEKFRLSRLNRGKKMVDKLISLGFFIDWKRVQAIAADGVIGRPHIARAMLEKGYINKFEDAFRYIGHDGPAYVPRDK